MIPYTSTQSRLLVRELPLSEQPLYRLRQQGVTVLSNAELVAAILQTPDALALAQELLVRFGGLADLVHASLEELQMVAGIGPARAAQVQAALTLGLRLLAEAREEHPQIRSPTDVAHLLMPEMGFLEHEELRTVLLDTKHRVRRVTTVYVGSLHTVAVRIGELFQEAIRINCAGMILVHNHPTGDPTPSPEDVRVTERVVQTGQMLDIDVLDHLIIGCNHRYVSLKERGLGFD